MHTYYAQGKTTVNEEFFSEEQHDDHIEIGKPVQIDRNCSFTHIHRSDTCHGNRRSPL